MMLIISFGRIVGRTESKEQVAPFQKHVAELCSECTINGFRGVKPINELNIMIK
jgi:hypothetical protein